MTFSIEWCGHKKDGAGKSHLWGILDYDYNAYIFWGTTSRIYLRSIGFETPSSYHYRKLSKIGKGYKQISPVDSIRTKWPEVIQDIEMQLVVRTLKNTLY